MQDRVVISNLKEMNGWRETTGREKQYIQEFLMQDAKSDIRRDRISNLITALLGFGMIGSAISNLLKMGDIFKTESLITSFALLGILVMLAFGGVVCECIVVSSIKKNKSKLYYNAIKNGEFIILDVHVDDDVTPTDSVYHFGIVSDLEGTQYAEKIRMCMTGTGKAILVYIDKIQKVMILPCYMN